LLEDSAENVHKLATAVKTQLERMREKLDVRFPVWVVVTSATKYPDSSSFFDDINDIELQHQMLGWSNPRSLSMSSFKPELLESHLETVIDGLRRTRLAKMQSMVARTRWSASV